ncbi:hypothetical protein RA876_16500 [Rhodoferax antarcticus]|nr:hypothetical protein RA876_16500 [Rhodoferax antarcticus]
MRRKLQGLARPWTKFEFRGEHCLRYIKDAACLQKRAEVVTLQDAGRAMLIGRLAQDETRAV